MGQKIGRVLTVEENALQGGFGSAVLELFQERNLFSIQVKRLGIPDLFIEHGPQSLLRAKYGIDENGIFEGVKKLVEDRPLSPIHPRQNKASVNRVIPHSK